MIFHVVGYIIGLIINPRLRIEKCLKEIVIIYYPCKYKSIFLHSRIFISGEGNLSGTFRSQSF